MSGNYPAVSDALLLSKVKMKDWDAFAELSVRYVWLIRTKAQQFEGSFAFEKEDLYQEGFLGLYVAALSFDEHGGAAFSTYAGVCIYNRMATAVRKHSSAKNKALNESVSLDMVASSPHLAEQSPEIIVEFHEKYERTLKRMEQSLSPLERKVLALYLGGYKRPEISEKLGISLKVFDNALHRVRGKLKNYNV